MDQWSNSTSVWQLHQLPVTNEDSFEDKRNYIQQTLTNMNQAIYGHMEAKTHILQVIGKWIRNPFTLITCLGDPRTYGKWENNLIKEWNCENH